MSEILRRMARRTGWVWACSLLTGLVPLAVTAASQPSPDAACTQDESACALCPPFGTGRPAVRVEPPETPTHATANHAQYQKDGAIVLTGNAQIDRPADRISGQELTYQKQPVEKITGSGDLWYETPSFSLQADRGWLEPQAHQGELGDARYWLNTRRATGQAQRVTQTAEGQYQLFQADYSTCPAEHRAWDITAARIDLNRETGRGQAHDAVLHAGGIPVFYFPYFDFPIDNRRQSGLLYPTFGSSTAGGLEYVQPYYWNIAPNRDATISPHLFTRRGLGLNAQYRDLHRVGARGIGRDQADLFWLPNDRVAGRSRWSLGLSDQTTLNDRVNWNFALNRVSDQQFFRDFSTDLNQAVTDNLASSFNLNASAGGWGLGLSALQFQTVNPAIPESAYPYRILPRLSAGRSFDLGWATFSLPADLTRFTHPDPALTTGDRAHIAPALFRQFRASWFDFTPKIRLDATAYSLDRGTADPLYGATDPQDQINRVLPISSLDGKLHFERRYGATGRYLAEFTPRAYYLYVPYRDQTAIPLFDTGIANLSYNQLFTDNRFTGGDRISDANSLTYGASWSLIDTQTGTMPLSLRLAQRYNFSQVRVAPLIDTGGSTVVAEAYSDLDTHWNGSVTTEYDSATGQLGRTQTRLGYRTDANTVANLSYYTKPTDTTAGYRQTDVSFAWQTDPHWQVLGRLGYDLEQHQIVQSLIGVGYDSCCWAARVALKRYVTTPQTALPNPSPNYANAILLEVELKGLGAFGAKNRFREEILGYDP
ncbi:LPS-assembly protein LptD [Halothiobacillus sp. DCM-1]|uniref:LPS-assembly protein LptD n=1 Tax=Halothiobacillus sp. DCM-1 TaxID=3112558 RepID=UPI00324F2EDB